MPPSLKLSQVARPEGGVFIWHGAGSSADSDHLIGLSLEDAAQLAIDLAVRVCEQRGPDFARVLAASIDWGAARPAAISGGNHGRR